MEKKVLTREERKRIQQIKADLRLAEQEVGNDFLFDENGAPVQCHTCGSYLFADGSCPVCE